MKTSTRTSLIKDTFQTLIQGNNTAVRQLQTRLDETRSSRRETDARYTAALDKFISSFVAPQLDEQALAAFAKANDGRVDFTRDFKERLRQSQQATEALQKLTDKHGRLTEVMEKSRAADAEFALAQTTRQQAEQSLERYNQQLAEIDAYNDKASTAREKGKDKPSIDDEKVEQFLRARPFTRLRRGGKLIRRYQKQYNGAAVAADLMQRAQKIKEIPGLRDCEKLKSQEKNQASEIYVTMSALSGKIISEKEAKADLSRQLTGLFSNRNFFNAIAANKGFIEALPKDMAARFAEITETRAKSDAFNKIETGLSSRIRNLTDATGQLEKGIGNVRKAERHSKYSVRIDLDDISKKIKVLQVLSVHEAAETANALQGIRDFNAQESAYAETRASADRSRNTYGYGYYGERNNASYGMLDFYRDMLIYNMLFNTTSPCDPFFVNNCMDISNDLAAQCDIDASSLSPQIDLSGLDASGIAQDFSSALQDTFNSVSDIASAIGSDLNSISSDISSAVSDFGSSISYDSSGGGYSGGFDGGFSG